MLTPTPAVGSGSVHGMLRHLLVAWCSAEFVSHRVRKMHAPSAVQPPGCGMLPGEDRVEDKHADSDSHRGKRLCRRAAASPPGVAAVPRVRFPQGEEDACVVQPRVCGMVKTASKASMLTLTPTVGSGSVSGLLRHLRVASHSPVEFVSHRVRKMHASCSLRGVAW
jgi:hypothetical protein